MGEIIKKYLSPEFNSKKSVLYKLSMLFSRDSFIYMVTRDREVMLLEEFRLEFSYILHTDSRNELLRFISQESTLHLDYYKINIGIDTFKTTLQPSSLVVEGKEDILLKSIAKVYPVDFILTNSWEKEDLIQITGFPEYILNSISKTFPEAEITHIYNSFHKYITKNILLPSNNLIISFKSSYAQVFIYNEGQLAYVNQFDYIEISDVIYFISKICNRYPIDEKEVNIHLCGKSRIELPIIIKELNYFYENVEKLNLNQIINPVDLNEYLELYSLSQ